MNLKVCLNFVSFVICLKIFQKTNTFSELSVAKHILPHFMVRTS